MRIEDQIDLLCHPPALAAPAEAGNAGSAGSPPVDNRVVSSTTACKEQTDPKGVTNVCLENENSEIEVEPVGIPLKDPVKKEDALLKRYDREGEEEVPTRDLRGGKRSRSPSLSESSESAIQLPREEQTVNINSTIGNDLQGQIWKTGIIAQNALADDIEAMEAAEEAAEQKAKSKDMFGLMTKGKKDNLIRDNRVNDLAQVREHPMAQANIGQVSKKIEGQLRTLGDPSQMSVALR